MKWEILYFIKLNSLFEYRWKPHERFHCPTTEHPYFFTRINSGGNYTTSPTSHDRNETSDSWLTGVHVDPLLLSLVFAMVVVLIFHVVRHLTRRTKTISISSEKDQRYLGNDRGGTSQFFNLEVKELRWVNTGWPVWNSNE